MVKVIKVNENFDFDLKKTIACIGYFDGVHKGHQQLIKKCVNDAKKHHVLATLITFDPDPQDLILNNTKTKHIFSFDRRIKIIESFNIDQIIVINFDKKLMTLNPIDFINLYLNRLNLLELICGFDFTFAYKASGNISLLKEYGNFELKVIDKYEYLNEKVSSTRIREALTEGDYLLVNELLGYTYYLDVIVTNVSKNENKWLIQAILKDDRGILPKDDRYLDKIEIKNQNIYFISDIKYQIGQEVIVKME